MKRETRKYTQEEKEKYLEEFENSSLSIKRYCRERIIPETTFRDWLKKREENKFGEISIVPRNSNIGTKNITIIIDKMKIELEQGYNKQLLKSFMEVLVK